MLQEIRRPDGELIQFEYDALGRRSAKIAAKQITRYIWDGNVLLHEWQYALADRPGVAVDESGGLRADPEPVDRESLITWIYEPGSFTPVAKLVGSERYSIISNYLGTPVQAFNDAGEKVWQRELDIYGAVREGSNDFVPFTYPGQYYDQETGLCYNRFRYYDPANGLYISKDPIGLAGNNPNLYGYVYNPNTQVDVFGLTLGLPAPKGTNPWGSGTIESVVVPKGGMEVEMVMSLGQTKPGGWATLDHIPDVDFVRNKLAVIPEFKQEISHVQKFHIPEGVRVQIGSVGPQTSSNGLTYKGGGNQVEIINFADRDLLEPIGKPRKINGYK